MFEQVSKKQYTLFGLIYMLSGFVLIGLSISFFMTPEKSIDIEKEGTKVLADCTNRLNKLYSTKRDVILLSGLKTPISYTIKYEDKKVKVASRSISGGLEMLKDADAMISICPGTKMTSFCMGSECSPIKGFNMTLEYNGLLDK